MEDQLISFETAKLAKEKGFYLSCTKDGCEDHYEIDGTLLGESDPRYYKQILFLAPSQSLLQKWLREERNMILEIRYFLVVHHKGYYHRLSDGNILLSTGFEFKSYEEALEIGLQKALELINE